MAITKPISATDDQAEGVISARELAALGGKKLVYVRAILARDAVEELPNEFADLDVDVDGDATLYAVHAADGERIALVGSRDLAFAAARQHEMNPVSVH